MSGREQHFYSFNLFFQCLENLGLNYGDSKVKVVIFHTFRFKTRNERTCNFKKLLPVRITLNMAPYMQEILSLSIKNKTQT